MDKFKFETSIQFPFFQLNEIVSYSEVKKPSGIAYMILVLVNESNDKDANLSKLLENFGVPSSLHYIYADTIMYLINEDILKLNQGAYFDRRIFNQYQIGDFEFSVKGKKIFAEESIPTGVTKDAKIPVFYNIALNELSLKIDESLEPKPLMDSAITEDFMNQFNCSKNVEDFINKNKGVKIPIYEKGKAIKNELIKTEEIITKVDEISKENWTAKYDCTMSLEGNKISFSFDNKVIEKFFFKHYNTEMLNKAIEYKPRFHFNAAFCENLKLKDFIADNLVEILIPKDIDEILKQKGQLFISKGNYINHSIFTIISAESIDLFNKSFEFVTVDNGDNKYGYVPGVFTFDNDTFNGIKIPLVLKIRLNNDEFKRLLVPYINSLKNYSEENLKTLVKITNISKDIDTANKVLEGYLTKNVQNNIVLLNEIKPLVMINNGILSKYKDLLGENYKNYISTINKSNFETVLKISSGIPKFLNISNNEVLDSIMKSLREDTDPVILFETLLNCGFEKSIVSLYVNPIPNVLSSKDAKHQVLLDFLNYNSSIEKMKNLSGINNPVNYVFDTENMDTNTFKAAYGTAKNLEKSIECFREKNEDIFKIYDALMNAFVEINDNINMSEAAFKNLKSINKELINKKIDSGDYQYVFVNMSAKLELILKNEYKLNGKLSEMLSEARRSGVIAKDIATDLHDFRENRNSYVHSNKEKINFRPDDLRRWTKEIFELEEIKK